MKALSALASGGREVADDDSRIRQQLNTYVARAFKQLYSTLLTTLEIDRKISESMSKMP